MAGGHMKYRTLSRSSAHRQALLRNLVTSLFKHESITTTWHKAKEAQRLAEKLVTLGKRNTQAAKVKAGAIFYEPSLVPKLFSTMRDRYADRPGGYTRVLRIEPRREDQAATAILELVDSPVDTRFAMAARAVASERAGRRTPSEVTAGNRVKATRFRPDGDKAFEDMVARFEQLDTKRQWAEGEKERWAEYEMKRKTDARAAKPEGDRAAWERWVVDEKKVEKKERVYPGLARSRV